VSYSQPPSASANIPSRVWDERWGQDSSIKRHSQDQDCSHTKDDELSINSGKECERA